MTQPPPHLPPQAPTIADDEIDLRELVSVLWRQRLTVVAVAAVGALVGVGASLASTKYVTEGLFLTPGLSATDFKRFESPFSSGPRLQQFLQGINQTTTTDGALLHSLAATPDGLADVMKPEFALTDKDQKAFGIKASEADAASAMIGVRLQLRHTEPTQGTPVTLLGEYVRDTLIRVNFETELLDRCTELSTREQELRNEQLSADFAITQEEKRAATLRDIIARNPDATASDNRQIVSLEKGNERFLSPAAQLVASEIQVADMKLAEVRRERERIASAIKRDYYCQAQQALQKPMTGRAFLEGLKDIQTAVFQNQDKSVDIIEQTWNTLDIERESWANTYLQSMRFLASPEGTEVKIRKPKLALGLVLGGVLGGMLGIFIALVRAWWRNEQVKAADKA